MVHTPAVDDLIADSNHDLGDLVMPVQAVGRDQAVSEATLQVDLTLDKIDVLLTRLGFVPEKILLRH